MTFEEFMEKYGLIYEMCSHAIMIPVYEKPLHGQNHHVMLVSIYSLTAESHTVEVIVKNRKELYELFLLCNKVLQTLNTLVTNDIQRTWHKCEEYKWVDT